MDATTLIAGMLISSIGVGYFMYGKNSGTAMPMVSGAMMCVYPYFIDNILYLVLISVAFILLPFIIKF